MKAHQRTRQEVAFTFHQSDKRSTAFIHTLLSQWPCCLEKLFNVAYFSLPFSFFDFYFFTLKDFVLIFPVQFKGIIVCILHMFLGGGGLRIGVLSVTVVKKKQWEKKGNMKTKSRKENIIRMRSKLLLCFCLPRRNPTHVSSCEFCCGYAEMSKRSSLEENPFGRNTRVSFYRGAISLPKINSEAHSFCHRKGLPSLFWGELICFANSWLVFWVWLFTFWVRGIFVRRDPPWTLLSAAVKETQTETWYCAKLWKCSPVLQDSKRTWCQNMRTLTGGLPLLFETFVFLWFDQVKPLLLLRIMGHGDHAADVHTCLFVGLSVCVCVCARVRMCVCVRVCRGVWPDRSVYT